MKSEKDSPKSALFFFSGASLQQQQQTGAQ
jgi:hypothetical protein